MTVADFCAEIKNYFDVKRSFGEFTIQDGNLIVDNMLDGQYFRIIGSVFNDGVYQYPATNLKDETFDGAVWYMAIPPDALAFVEEMSEWENKNANAINSPYSSESFGGYYYTKASNSNSTGDDSSVTAFSHFAAKLNHWRKVRCI